MKKKSLIPFINDSFNITGFNIGMSFVETFDLFSSTHFFLSKFGPASLIIKNYFQNIPIFIIL